LGYNEYWEKIYEKNNEVNSLVSSYWQEFSDFTNWQFWFVLVLFVLPLIILYFTVDRKMIFELFFFGFFVHVLWTYTELFLNQHNFFVHTYFLIPYDITAISINASLLPVGFLLIYQYCTKHQKNFYLYAILLSLVFSFGFASLELYLGLVALNGGMNLFYVFLIDLAVVFLSYWFTKIVRKIKESETKRKEKAGK